VTEEGEGSVSFLFIIFALVKRLGKKEKCAAVYKYVLADAVGYAFWISPPLFLAWARAARERPRPVVVEYYSTYFEAVRVGGWGWWRTFAMRYD
jgi:hypothetical protein